MTSRRSLRKLQMLLSECLLLCLHDLRLAACPQQLLSMLPWPLQGTYYSYLP